MDPDLKLLGRLAIQNLKSSNRVTSERKCRGAWECVSGL